MPTRQLYVITIQFTGAAPFVGSAQSDRMLRSRDIRLVESHAGPAPKFTLHDGDAPEYTLGAQESAQLTHLLGQIEIKVPWQALAGLDGIDYELTLLGAMSSATFRWWVEIPAGWEQVGALFDYVLAIADSRRASES